jgi:hypothetical protein
MHIPIPAFGESLPKTKCHIRIDDPHISKFLRLKKQIEPSPFLVVLDIKLEHESRRKLLER